MTTKHSHPVVFGRREVGCPRCEELAAGAAPVRWAKSRKEQDARAVADVHAHFNGERHRSGGCGPVCTFGEW